MTVNPTNNRSCDYETFSRHLDGHVFLGKRVRRNPKSAMAKAGGEASVGSEVVIGACGPR